MNKTVNSVATSSVSAPLPPAILMGDSASNFGIEAPKRPSQTASRAELIAANEKLRAALARHRAIVLDLRDILFGMDVPALVLDPAMNIRAFTPAASALFGLLPGDVGKPATRFARLAAGAELRNDAHAVLRGGAPIEREYRTGCGAWFVRRVMPYRARTDAFVGAVVTFADISEVKRQAHELADAGDELRRVALDLAPARDALGQDENSARTREILAGLGDQLERLAHRLGAPDAASAARPNSALSGFPLIPGMPDADAAARRVDGLSKRQREILDLVLAGHPSKNIAADLGISQRTVEGHRAAIMKKLGVKSLPALACMAMAAAIRGNTGAAAAAAIPPA